MYPKTHFDAKRDIMTVEPGLSIDISQAIENGVVQDTGEPGVFNDMSEPSSIGSRVTDPFTAVDMQKTLLNSAAKSKAKAAEAAAAAAAAAAPTTE